MAYTNAPTVYWSELSPSEKEEQLYDMRAELHDMIQEDPTNTELAEMYYELGRQLGLVNYATYRLNYFC